MKCHLDIYATEGRRSLNNREKAWLKRIEPSASVKKLILLGLSEGAVFEERDVLIHDWKGGWLLDNEKFIILRVEEAGFI